MPPAEIPDTAPGPVDQHAVWSERTGQAGIMETGEGREHYVVVVLFLFSLAYLSFFRHVNAMEPDEGILLQGAQRILVGQVLYRDFFSFYTPGSYYLLALLFRACGSSIIVARSFLAFAGALLSLLTYRLARRVCSRKIAVTFAVLTTITTLPYRFLVLHNWDSALWTCLALYSAIRVTEQGQARWAFGLGFLVSLTTLFEQSKGVGLGIGLLGGFALIYALKGGSLLNRRQVYAAVLGFSLPLTITIAYFIRQHAFASMMADCLWPLQHYSAANRVPYGYQNWSDETRHLLFGTGSWAQRLMTGLVVSPCFWIPVVPLLAVGLMIFRVTKAWPGRQCDGRSAYYILVTACISGLLLTTFLTRADIIHLMYLQPLNCLVLAWICDGRDIPGELLGRLRRVWNPYSIASLVVFALVPLWGALSAKDRVNTRHGVIATRSEDTVINYVQARVPAGEHILVYPYLPLYYYTTATFSPSRFDYFQPGMHTREQANSMIADLERQRTRVVLFENGFSQKIPNAWPATSLAAITEDPVGDYIVKNYRMCQVLASPLQWRLLYMVRKGTPCT
jgi:4-amino-4-deoxy-L-arabinose transferase-like glycosyltransferase